jgi:hypothetical protein
LQRTHYHRHASYLRATARRLRRFPSAFGMRRTHFDGSIFLALETITGIVVSDTQNVTVGYQHPRRFQHDRHPSRCSAVGPRAAALQALTGVRGGSPARVCDGDA